MRTVRELRNKFSSFEHSHEVLSGWIESKWTLWQADPQSTTDLHPTSPSAYKRTKEIGFHELPSPLKSVVYNSCHRVEVTPAEVFRDDDFDAFDIICGGARPVANKDAYEAVHPYGYYVPAASNSVAHRPSSSSATMLPIQTQFATIKAEGTSAESAHGDIHQISTIVDVNDISDAHITDLDPTSATDTYVPCDKTTPPKVMILIVCEGEYDYSTEPVFTPIANILLSALQNLFRAKYPATFTPDSVTISTCVDLRFCRNSGERFMIILGAHHLSRYSDAHGNVASIASDFPQRDRTAIFNFEEISMQTDFRNGKMWDVLSYYESVWDYSLGNHRDLIEAGVRNQYLPLGWPGGQLQAPVSSLPFKKARTDVLFYGRLNGYRSAIIKQLREEGISVRHVNAGQDGVWGDELDKHILASKIVLSLRYYGQEDSVSTEWKFTRFIAPLTLGTMIISELSGTEEEMSHWTPGIKFVPRSELTRTLKYYLQNDDERSAVARRGLEVLQSGPNMNETLALPLEKLVQGRCGDGWGLPQ